MAKTNTPFFGLGSQGSVGKSITTQRRGRDTIIRSLPLPTDPYSLPQAYQRWLYQDYAHWWTLQSQAVQRSYAATGSRFHLTGFQYWMKDRMTTLPFHAAIWHLDNNIAGKALDFSRNTNSATIIGASPAIGIIDSALSFDGINDWLQCGTDPSIIALSNFCLETFTYIPDLSVHRGIWRFSTTQTTGLIALSTKQLQFYGGTTGAGFIYLTTPVDSLIENTWQHISLNWTPTLAQLLINGIVLDSQVNPGTITAWNAFQLGRAWQAGGALHYFAGRLDHPTLTNIALDVPLLLKHSRRRYPA